MKVSNLVRRSLRNRVQTLVIMVSMAAVLAGAGALLAGATGAWWALVMGVVFAIVAPRAPTELVMRTMGARVLEEHEAPGLHALTREISERAGLERAPALYYSPQAELNAFAIGQGDDTAIGITRGVLERLSPDEIAGVLAHEIAHIRHGDIRLMTLADVFSRMTRGLSTIGKFAFFIALPLALFGVIEISWLALAALMMAPAFSGLLRLALSRSREHDADTLAASLTGDPRALARALEKIEFYSQSPIARLFGGRRRAQGPEVLRTHPHTGARIEALLELEADARAPRLSALSRFRPVTPEAPRPPRVSRPRIVIRWG